MRIDEFEFRNGKGQEIEPTKAQLVIYIKSLHKYIKDLETKLAESEKQVNYLFDKNGEQLKLWNATASELMIVQRQLTDKEKEYKESIEKILSSRDKLVLEYTQDKISFAVEQLEKVKEMVKPYLRFDWNLYLQVCENIDNQINVLRNNKDGIH